MFFMVGQMFSVAGRRVQMLNVYGWACSVSVALMKQVVVEVIFEAGDGAGEGAEDEEGAEEDFSPAI